MERYSIATLLAATLYLPSAYPTEVNLDRNVLLNAAKDLAAAGRNQAAAKVYLHGVQNWAGEDNDYQRQACKALFDELFIAGNHNEGKSLLSPCPADQLKHLYGQIDRDYVSMVKVAPKYPRKHLFGENSGVVRVLLDISTEGKSTNIRVIEQTDRAFGRAARRAVEQYRYLPSIENGVAVATMDIEEIVRFEYKRSVSEADPE